MDRNFFLIKRVKSIAKRFLLLSQTYRRKTLNGHVQQFIPDKSANFQVFTSNKSRRKSAANRGKKCLLAALGLYSWLHGLLKRCAAKFLQLNQKIPLIDSSSTIKMIWELFMLMSLYVLFFSVPLLIACQEELKEVIYQDDWASSLALARASPRLMINNPASCCISQLPPTATAAATPTPLADHSPTQI